MNMLCKPNPIRLRFAWTSKVSVYLFYVSFFMYVAASMARDTTIRYSHVEFYRFLLYFYWIPVILAAVNILFLTDYTVRQMIIYTAFAVALWVSYKNFDNFRLFHSFVILLSARNVEWKTFVKRTFLLYGALLLAVFLAYCAGILYGVDIYRRGDMVRWTLGFVHPNLLGGYVMVFAMLWVAVRYEAFRAADAVGIILLSVFTWFGPSSRTSALLIVLLLAIVLVSKLCGKWLLRCPVTRFCLIYSYPICFLLIFACSYLYSDDSAFFVRLDSLLSGRVRFGHLFLEKYYHTWFGQKVKQVSSRSALLKGTQTMYLDSAYMRLYVGFGIVACLITLWIFTRIMRYAVENARWDIISGAVVMAAYGISEQYIINLHWNFYLILFAMIPEIRRTRYALSNYSDTEC